MVFVKDSYDMAMSVRTFRPISLHVVYCLPAHVGDSFWRSLDPPFIHFNSTTNKGERSGHLHGGTAGFDQSRKLAGRLHQLPDSSFHEQFPVRDLVRIAY